MKFKTILITLLSIIFFTGCSGEIVTTLKFDKKFLYKISLEKMDIELYYGADEVVIIDDGDGYLVESYYSDNKSVVYRIYYDYRDYETVYVQKETTNPHCYSSCEEYYFMEEEYIYID